MVHGFISRALLRAASSEQFSATVLHHMVQTAKPRSLPDEDYDTLIFLKIYREITSFKCDAEKLVLVQHSLHRNATQLGGVNLQYFAFYYECNSQYYQQSYRQASVWFRGVSIRCVVS